MHYKREKKREHYFLKKSKIKYFVVIEIFSVHISYLPALFKIAIETILLIFTASCYYKSVS